MKNFRVFMVGLLCLLVCTSLAQAQPLVWDVSVAGAPAYGDADALTGVFDQIGFYSQTSTIQFDTDGDAVPSPGDRLVDAGDLRVRSLLSSKIIDTEGLNQFGGYEVTARWTDVEGYITGTTLNPATGDTRIDIRYTSGTLNLYLDPALDSKFANPAGTATPAGAGGTGFENGTPIATLSVKDGIGHTFIDLNGGDIDNQGSAELYLQFTTALNGFWRDAAGGVIDPVGTIVTALVDMNIDSTTHVDGVPAGALYTAYSNQDGSILVDTAQCYGRIGDYVWLDKDRDGLQDEGEPGINGVALNLFDAAGNLIASTTTDTAGYYQFEGLCFGDYTVEIDETTVPAGYFPTTSLVGDDRSVDSNVSPAYVSLSETTPSDQTIDFGYQSPCTGEIGDFVWNDINKNGIQDSLEPGIPDVTVWLKDLSGEIIAETQTNVDGFYLFSGLCSGSYIVEVNSPSLPMGLLPTLDNQGDDDALDSDGSPVTVTLPQDDAVDRTIDFGYYQATACIGDFVWNDANADGIQDDNESGIPLVKVVLLDCAGTYVAETLTNEDGWYEFCNVEPGDYKVQFVLPGGYAFSPMNQGGDDALDSDADPTTGTTACTTLEPGETDLTWDAGMYLPCTGSIGNYVWNDVDKDGIQDEDETGIAGVTVKLLMDGQVVATATTDGNGYYLFTELCPGTYTVEVMTPAGYLPTPICSNDPTVEGDANCSPQTVVSNNDSNTTIDFGFYMPCTGSIGNYVWNDADRDGIQDADETGIAGVTVKLLMDGQVVATATTDGNGYYLFTNLCPGTYTVEVVTPAGYLPTPVCSNDAGIDGDANCSPQTVVSNNDSNTTIDFGFYVMSASLGDYVWNDANNNGVQDAGEVGIAGVTVNLIDCATNTEVATTTTAADGMYLFQNLMPGSYWVEFVAPMGYAFTTPNVGSDATDSDANASGVTDCITLAAGESNTTVDAGLYVMPASIGDYVWTDANNNGVQDAGEMGIPNVTVKLFDCTTDEPVATTTTDADGKYLFEGLMPGSYRVEFVAPTGYAFTLPNQGGDDALDSDANASGVTECITLAAGESNTTVDAGLYQPAPAIDIEKYTNGEDADTPTGPMVAVGSEITWTYVVTNHGNVTLTNVMVVDNQGVSVSCPSTTLLPSEVMTCTGYGTAVAGQYANLGTVTGDYNGMTVTDSDPSHYFAAYPSIDVEKYVSTNGTNWFDADQAPGIEVTVCPDLNCDAETEYECQQKKDYYWKEFERTKYEHDSKKNDYEKKKSDRDRSRSVHDKAKYNRDSSKKNCDVKQKEYESAKSKYESSKSYLDKRRMDKAKSEYDSAKSECDKKDSDYNWKKSDHDTKKSDCDRAKAEYDKAKADHSKAKNDWEKRKDRDCGVPTDPQCGTDTCQSSVYFKFVVTNTGTVPLGEMSLDDSIYDTSSCVIPATLAPGEVYDCVIGPEDAVAGQHTNTATATGTYMGAQVTDTDDANYFGKVPCTPLGTGTPGYWMNHPEAWPVYSITIGGVVYTKDKAILLMKSPVKLDKTYTMFPALVSAKLNVLSCNESSCIAATIQAADDWMRVYGPVGSGVLASSSAWQIGEPLYLLLDEYNNGLLCAPSRDTLENDYADHKGCSTKTVSYWVDSTKYWPSKEVRIGGKTYDKATAISCMKGSKTKDGSYIMYRALASAKLNALEGNDVSCIADTLRAADEWMYKYGPCGKGVAPGSWAWKTGEPIWQKLDDYNNGKLDVVYKKDRKTTTYISYWTR